VPEVLRSGDHGAIARWRLEQQRRRTRERRPDLYERWLRSVGPPEQEGPPHPSDAPLADAP
jgi:tRNA (guanine-N1)-methyltransferase